MLKLITHCILIACSYTSYAMNQPQQQQPNNNQTQQQQYPQFTPASHFTPAREQKFKTVAANAVNAVNNQNRNGKPKKFIN